MQENRQGWTEKEDPEYAFFGAGLALNRDFTSAPNMEAPGTFPLQADLLSAFANGGASLTQGIRFADSLSETNDYVRLYFSGAQGGQWQFGANAKAVSVIARHRMLR